MNGYIYNNEGKLNVKRVVLETVKIAGVISMAVAAPNAIKSLKILDKIDKPKYRKWYVDKTIEKLIKQKLIKVEIDEGKKILTLTSAGDKLLDRYDAQSVIIPKPKKWDGKYRLVIFDIKEGTRRIRDELRHWLQELGFIKLQNSVWVYPYECREIVVLLKSRLGVGSEVLYLTVDSIEDGYKLRKAFDL